MHKKPLVSIAIITYNQKDLLRDCIESCLQQTYDRYQIIIADDCSTDGTQDMLREYEKKYPGKFKLALSNENQGITKNSNAAHSLCEGEYIAWMGGDDLMMPEKISKQVLYMERHPECTLCYHDLDVFDSETNKTIYIQSERIKPREGAVALYIKHGVFNGACSTMVRKEKTPKEGFEELLPVASDWYYWVECLINGGEIRYIPELLGRYRRHDGNVTVKRDVIGQNSIDHLNSCNLIMSKYPMYFREASYCYSMNIRSLRSRLPYFSSLLYVCRNVFDLKSFFALALFVCTFGKIRI